MHRKSSLFVLAAAGALMASGVAQAAPVVSFTLSSPGSQSSQAAPRSAESDFIASLLPGYVTETFENFAVGTQGSPFGTAVGTFTQVTAGYGGACEGELLGCGGGVAILDAGTSPFSGRFNTTDGGTKWLDSFDSMEFLFSPNEGVNAVGFYITDPNDSGGRFAFKMASGEVSIDFGKIFGNTGLSNGRLFYLTFVSSEDITGLTILSNNRDDGFGVDDVTVGRVPEPGTLALLGLGLLGVAAMRRRS
jgi:hypothetical protein